MFLHAYKLTISHPASGARIAFEAPLPADLTAFLQHLSAADAQTV